jgi:hypothetical protein
MLRRFGILLPLARSLGSSLAQWCCCGIPWWHSTISICNSSCAAVLGIVLLRVFLFVPSFAVTLPWSVLTPSIRGQASSSLYPRESRCRFGIPWQLSAVPVVAIRHSHGGISAIPVVAIRHSHGGISAIPVVTSLPFSWWRCRRCCDGISAIPMVVFPPFP